MSIEHIHDQGEGIDAITLEAIKWVKELDVRL